ncbi:MAG: hypothetical protein AW08_03260 [Candidatus Accumulibacter adjunctus]|uniref:tRNA-guanine(15) transglycosylase-like domain-containing protein n=1 Tax=Candidatus Accumulibacter adjunctus TaxID=1454001 RepID=A0A011MRX2_9PROT|nr:MAG: hypothetical protein AW08_03260 [Candidatus Accumulibacter adjunctus]
MKFVFADSMDYVDPKFDFIKDQTAPTRRPYWDDQYPHEVLGFAPYDGMLVSRAIVGDHRFPGKYTEAQAMRFRRVGARKFLRLDGPTHADMMLMGDCGAFSYSAMEVPPYTPEDTVEFYADGGFTHGCSIDHIIFEFDPSASGDGGGSDLAHERFDITLDLADRFLRASRGLGEGFTPIGVVQGWSPDSMARAAHSLLAMGYRYLAIGGLVPLKTEAIHKAVEAVDAVVRCKSDARMHLLGFAKADDIGQFSRYRVASFDTTSPLIRAFKDARRNYYLRDGNRTISYYTAVRIPQAYENNALLRQVKSGRLRQETLAHMESSALSALRDYSKGRLDLESVLDAVIDYAKPLHWSPREQEQVLDRRMATLRKQYRQTLEARPWERCRCSICTNCGVEVIVYRGSNRNKRRGIHNLGVFRDHLRQQLAS